MDIYQSVCSPSGRQTGVAARGPVEGEAKQGLFEYFPTEIRYSASADYVTEENGSEIKRR